MEAKRKAVSLEPEARFEPRGGRRPQVALRPREVAHDPGERREVEVAGEGVRPLHQRHLHARFLDSKKGIR